MALTFMDCTVPLSHLMTKSGYQGYEVRLCFHCKDSRCPNIHTFAKKETFDNWESVRSMPFDASDFDQAAYRKAYHTMHMALRKGKSKCQRYQATTTPSEDVMSYRVMVNRLLEEGILESPP